ncbi:MAG: hypothetical protein ACTHJM_02520 [Marmoricola sp.]
MQTTTHTAPANIGEAQATAWPLAGRLIDAITRRSFADLEACLAPDVRMRAVLPRRVLELDSAAAVARTFEDWFGGEDGFEVMEASAGSIGPRHHVRWRIRMWPRHAGGGSRVVEQQIYTWGTEQAESLDLLCSGFHAEHIEGPR